MNVRCWGSGGTASTSPGGGGGFTYGDLINLVPGETLLVVVGNRSGFGGQRASDGGGMSGIYSVRLNRPLLIAGEGDGDGSSSGAPDGAGVGGENGHGEAVRKSSRAGNPGDQLPLAGMGGDDGGSQSKRIEDGDAALHFVSHEFAKWSSGGGGGSGFVSSPDVSGGNTVAGSRRSAAGKSDPLYEQGIGDAGHNGQVVFQWAVPVNLLEE